MPTSLFALAALTVTTPVTDPTDKAPCQGDGCEIIVTAEGTPRAAEETGLAITVLPPETIAQRQVRDLGSALRLVPGVTVAGIGVGGGQTSAFIRGAESAHTLVVIDGVRANDPASPTGAFDFGGVGLSSVSRVEVLRGVNALGWGSQAIGGVVDLRTAALAGDRLVGGMEGGDRGRLAADAAAAQTIGSVDVGVTAGWRRDRGVSALAGGTERDGFDATRLTAKVEWDAASDVRLGANVFYDRARVDYDATFAPDAANSQVDTVRRLVLGALTARIDTGALRHDLAVSRADTRRVGRDAAGEVTFNDYRIDGRVDRGDYRLTWPIDAAVTLVVGAEVERSRARVDFPAGGAATPDEARRTSWGALAQLRLSPANALAINAGLRLDGDAGRTTMTHAVDVAWRPGDGPVIIRAARSTGFRLPSLTEALLPYGNPALRPERAINHSIGASWSDPSDRLSIEVTGWTRRSRDLILFDLTTYRSENIARAMARGVEVSVDAQPAPSVRLFLTGAWTDSRDKSNMTTNANRLPRRPWLSGSLSLQWSPTSDVNTGIVVAAQGPSFDDRTNTVRLPGFATMALTADLRISEWLTLYGRVENVTAAEAVTVAGYAGLPRGVVVGVRVTP